MDRDRPTGAGWTVANWSGVEWIGPVGAAQWGNGLKLGEEL